VRKATARRRTAILTRRKSCTLAEIVRRFGGELIGKGGVRINQVAALESAQAGHITFLSQPQYLPQLAGTRASAVIVAPETRNATRLPRIVSDNPHAYFAKVSGFFNPPPPIKGGVHRSAVVDRTARIPASASVGPCAVVGKNVRIGPRAAIGPGCSIGDGVTIGEETRLHANVTVYHDCRIGARCLVHSGAVIGADGFGLASEKGVWKKIPQIGRVMIGNDVEIGANTTIDRGALDDTTIEDGVKLDNQIQIGHNVRIGAHTAIAACVGIAGSTKIGEHCAIGGAAMISGHITIADHVTVSGGTVIMKSLHQPGIYTGVFPAALHQNWLKNASHLRRLDELADKIRDLEHRLLAPERGQS